MTNRDIRFINMAVEIAKGSPRFADQRIAAVVAIKNELISTGYNTDKKHPIALKYARNEDAIYPHAEVLAIHNASKALELDDFRKTTLYVARVKKTAPRGNTVKGIAMPCTGCQKMIEQFGIKRVIFTLEDNAYGMWTGGDW